MLAAQRALFPLQLLIHITSVSMHISVRSEVVRILIYLIYSLLVNMND